MKIPGMPKVKAYVTIVIKDMYSLILYMQSMIQEDMEDQSQLEIPWMKCGLIVILKIRNNLTVLAALFQVLKLIFLF